VFFVVPLYLRFVVFVGGLVVELWRWRCVLFRFGLLLHFQSVTWRRCVVACWWICCLSLGGFVFLADKMLVQVCRIGVAGLFKVTCCFLVVGGVCCGGRGYSHLCFGFLVVMVLVDLLI